MNKQQALLVKECMVKAGYRDICVGRGRSGKWVVSYLWYPGRGTFFSMDDSRVVRLLAKHS